MRVMVLVAACVLVLGSAAGGTLAWLANKTLPVTNVFTSAHISLALTETDTQDGDNDPNTNSYLMLPGTEITKDPVVTVHAGSEEAWLFVKLDRSENFDSFLYYEMAEGWNALGSLSSVYWRKVPKADADQSFGVIADSKVLVKPNVTAFMLNTLTPDMHPTLTVTAYAVQQASLNTAEEAWALALTQSITP